MNIGIRPVAAGDHRGVDTILTGAFGRPEEAELVQALRVAGDLPLELLAERDGAAVGHIAFQDLGLRGDAPGPVPRIASLAPLAVLPAAQGQGIGSALVAEALAILVRRAVDLVVVLGEPAYYGRFGFRADVAAPYRAPWSSRHFQGLRLSDRAIIPAGDLIYPAAFGASA